MCVAGGKRCKYSDALANVRKKTRVKHAGEYNVEYKVEESVRRFQEENPELVQEHLPLTMGFQWQPPQLIIPDSLTQLMGKPRAKIIGGKDDNKEAFFKELYERRQLWKAALTPEEKTAVAHYTGTGYEYMNTYLRRHGFSEWLKKNGETTRVLSGEDESFVDKYVIPRVRSLDLALKKKAKDAEPEKVYRFYRAPAGVTAQQYMAKYLTQGSGFKDRGFLSTTADPEYIAAHVLARSGTQAGHHYFVMEILTKQGVSLQPSEHTDSGNVQALEAEILLPRNTGLHIVGSGKKRFEFGKDRQDLSQRYSQFSTQRRHDFTEGKGVSLPVLQMIDTQLVRDVNRQEKK